MIETILSNPYLGAFVILITQFVFLYLRTLNVVYVSELKTLPAIVTGNLIGLAWLLSIAIGVQSVAAGEILPIVAFLIGGTAGTMMAINKEKKKQKKKDGRS